MRLKQNILVRRPHDISVSWAQHIVNHHSAGAKVSQVKIHSIDVGTTTRIRVMVEHNAPRILPRRWFVKMPSMAFKPRILTALPRFLHKEVNFYREVSRSVPVKLPPILAAQSQFGRGSTLVLADVAEQGAAPGHPSDALSFKQSKLVVEHLAQFHARFWDKAGLAQRHRWLGEGMEDHMGKLLAVPLMKRGLSLAGHIVPKRLHAAALRYAGNRHQLMRGLSSGPKTLVHHDCHPGNLFWTSSQPGFLDWQLIRLGEGIGDVAYFLATALEPECRRAHEKQLLSLYLATLAQHGVKGLDQNREFLRYRAHLAYPLEAMILTLAIGDMMEFRSNLELIRRASAAAEDHDAFAALAV